MENTRVIVADGHPATRLGIRAAFESESDIEVVGEAGDGIEAVLVVERLEPDVLILELFLPEMNGVQAVRHVRVNNPEVRILALSATEDEDAIGEMLGAGIHGYVHKTDSVSVLIGAVRAVAQSQSWFTPQIMPVIARRVADPRPDQEPAGGLLTTRELEVLQRVARGRTNEEIATSLNITERTVRYHMENIFAKLRVTTRINALIEALRQGLVKV